MFQETETNEILSRSDHAIWVNYNELTTSSLEIIVSKGNHPQMAARFRLVNYYNLPRYIKHECHGSRRSTSKHIPGFSSGLTVDTQ